MSFKNNSNYPLAYLDEEQENGSNLDPEENSNREEGDPSQNGEGQNNSDEDGNDALHKNPRFQKVIKNWRNTERELNEVREHSDQLFTEVEALKKAQQEFQSNSQSKDAPDYWSKLYETPEQANAAWGVMNKTLEERESKLREQLKQEMSQTMNADNVAQTRWESHIQKELNKLEELYPNLDVTSNSPQAKKLRGGIRKVWEDYSPTNDNGELVFIPIEKAYDILQKEDQLEKKPKQEARRNLAGLSTQRAYPNDVQNSVRPAQNQVKNTSKFGRLPWRSQINVNE